MAAETKHPINVAIIGGGSGGLVMGRHLIADPDKFTFTIFEQTGNVGGTWVYTDRTGTDENGLPVHSSMYKNLRTNLPKELMAFLDFPFSEGGSSYLHRDEVLKYLNDYCDHFGLRKFIKLFTRVVNVHMPKADTKIQWEVEIENVLNKNKEVQIFDAVVVCNGHYSVPRYPKIEGLENFKGKIMHSHDYRTPEIFAGLNVLCIGAGSSGVDITIEAAEVANKVVLSHDLPSQLLSPFPGNVKEMPWIASCTSDGFNFKNGDFFQTDVLVVCTGYEYSFPFLSPECGISVLEHRVTNLFKHVVNIRYPSMAILAIPFTTVPFVVADIQAQFVVKVFEYPSLLPNEIEMVNDTAREIARKSVNGSPPRHFHKFVYKIWDYLNELTSLVGLKPVPKSREMLYQLSFDNRMLNFCTFRNLNYGITETEVFYR